jgi:serine/threonine-protein kinase RsbW
MPVDDVDPGIAALAGKAVVADRLVTGQAGTLELVSIPLRARDHRLGVLTLAADLSTTDASVTPVLATRIATRAALALDNALRYEQELDASHTLQLGLLGEAPAQPPGTEIETAYLPGTATLAVGGDWYDAFSLPDGRLALVVGDVVGHGVEAAVAMGQLRGAVRALAPMGTPRDLLNRLDQFVEQLPPAAMATLVYVELDVDSGHFRYACAGHPPPVIVPGLPQSEARLLWDGRSTPLGSAFGTVREEAVDCLKPGDSLLLYTDGLVEHRSCGIAEGLERLVEVTTGGVHPRHLIDRVISEVVDESLRRDDVCLLGLRFVPQARFAESFPASPAEVARARRAFASWVEDAGVDESRRLDAILALSEAAANAAEHAYGFDGVGLVRVEAWVSNGSLHVAVSDDGRWVERRHDPVRGRGHVLIEALMDAVTIDTGASGTTVRMSIPTMAGVAA